MKGGGDDGVATVWAAVGLAVLMAAVLLGLYLGSALLARHRAAAAADLAALAAAAVSVLGDGPACARAGGIAAEMGAELTGCALDGWDVLVQVRVPVGLPLPAGGPTEAVGRAAAGPVADSTHFAAVRTARGVSAQCAGGSRGPPAGCDS